MYSKIDVDSDTQGGQSPRETRQGIRQKDSIQRPGELDQNRRSDTSHTSEVMRKYYDAIRKAKKEMPDGSYEDHINKAYLDLADDRNSSKSAAADEALRDAEYFAMCEAAALAGDGLMAVACQGGLAFYDFLKLAAQALSAIGLSDVEKAMRTSNLPTSRPGLGSVYGYMGFVQGTAERRRRKNP